MMRRGLLSALVLLSAFRLSAGDAADGVRACSAGWRKAVVDKDTAVLDRLLAPDLTYTHANGRTQDKAEYIAAIKATGRYESFTESDTKIRVYGKTAILTGFVDVKIAGQDSYRVRTIEVYVENSGQWQLTAKQSARINR
jgi:ketosteroid isomerase-like protein